MSTVLATLYKDANCSGESYNIDDNNMNELTSMPDGWNNKLSSIHIWEHIAVVLYEDDNYKGDSCLLIGPGTFDICTGQKKEDGQNIHKFNDKTSSIRVIETDCVVFFRDDNWTGSSTVIKKDSEHMPDGWNDETSSVYIHGNLTATLYKDHKYKGSSVTLIGPGTFDLSARVVKNGNIASPDHFFNDKVTSIKIKPNPAPQNTHNDDPYNGMRFLKGDLHNHTAYSDAEMDGNADYFENPDELFRGYRCLNYDFVASTDHTFGKWANGNVRYVTYGPTGNQGRGGVDYSLRPDNWDKTKDFANDALLNYNFSAFPGFEFSLGGIATETDLPTTDNNPHDTVAHYNVINADIYYGQDGKWNNTPSTRKDFYDWANKQNDIIVQINHPRSKVFTEDEFAGFWSEKSDERFKLIETLKTDGDWIDVYKRALKNGFHISPAANSDNHDGFDALKGKFSEIRTIVISSTNTKADILSAIRRNRVYATKQKDLVIKYSIGDNMMGSVITKSPQQNLSFVVDISGTNDVGNICVYSDVGQIESIPSMIGTGRHTFEIPFNPDDKYYYVLVKTAIDTDTIAVTTPIWVNS
ncbi:MAG: peptidase inhibitor family I36 protein [Solirubrobacterales bacterium]